MTGNSWLSDIATILSILTPLLVIGFGVYFHRRLEGIRAEASRQSDFRTKWAEQFFNCCQDFLRANERNLALICRFPGLPDKNGSSAIELTKEVEQLHIQITELSVRIRRCLVFAPKTGQVAVVAAKECLDLVSNSLKAKHVNVDEIIESMNRFNKLSRDSHAEMLGI